MARRILETGAWPRTWCFHWIMPLHKRASLHDPANYRGIQLTSQLSKCLERILGCLFLPRIYAAHVFGKHQFAYRPHHGARDALLYLLVVWLRALACGHRIAVYCSDVAGAFDCVSAERLVAKLHAAGIHPKIVRVLRSWLSARSASVVVNGSYSTPLSMQDMVYSCIFGSSHFGSRHFLLKAFPALASLVPVRNFPLLLKASIPPHSEAR